MYFEDIYKEDKSKDKKESSELMWAIYECYHYNGDFVNLQDNDKITIINSLFKTTDKDVLRKIEPVLPKFYNLIETPARKSLREWESKMTERYNFIKETPYTLDYYEVNEETGREKKIAGTHKMLDDMMKATEDIWDSYWKIQEKINQEKSKNTGEAGAELSLVDQGKI